MPFRYMLKKAGSEHPVGYSLAMFAIGMIICMMAAVVISVRASDRAIRDSERRQCETIQADVDAYLDEPPTTPAGWNQLRAKQARIVELGCPKPKEE